MRGKHRCLVFSAALAFALLATAACEVEVDRDAEADLERAEANLEAAGEELERGAEEVGRELEPYARDAAITARVKTRLAADPEVNPFTIDVDTVNRKVTLTGTVRTEEQRQEAEDLARGTEGVTEVVNLLEVETRG